MLFFWIIIFTISLFLLVKGADWLIDSSEKIGLALGLSPFIVGVTIVGVGTSLPELFSSWFATIKGLVDVAAANTIGSNIANILLIVGVSAILAKRLCVTKSLIDLDLPLLSISTVLFLGIAWDQKITLAESILLLATYAIYFLYTLKYQDQEDSKELPEVLGYEVLPSRKERRSTPIKNISEKERPKIKLINIGMLIGGIAGLVIGSEYLIKALVNLSNILHVATGIITITAVAVGTSLPELLVSAKAAFKKKSEVALGNIFGSNIFNGLVVVGFSGLFKTLVLDEKTFLIGLPTMALATLLFVISGISRRIHVWEGAFYLMVYILFIAKLINLF